MSPVKHIPVLLEPIMEFFQEIKIKTFVDGTVGAGGHSKALLERHPETVMLFGFDQDEQAIELSEERLKEEHKRVTLIRSNFSNMKEELEERGIRSVDGILLDLGVSSMQLDYKERGFSFSKEGPLDMRMDRESPLSAEVIINEWPEKKIGLILEQYGDIVRWKALTKLILEERKKRRIRTTTHLVEVLSRVLKPGHKPKIHPATLVFQALRIAVNNELGVLEKGLPMMMGLLNPGGRLGVISFHSGEDRIVKNIFRDASKKTISFSGEEHPKVVHLLTPKPVTASVAEIKKNPRSRSAKLRFVEKI